MLLPLKYKYVVMNKVVCSILTVLNYIYLNVTITLNFNILYYYFKIFEI